jgi:CheY-like chemotaxis protein
MPTIDGYMLANVLIKAQYNWSKSTQRKTVY